MPLTEPSYTFLIYHSHGLGQLSSCRVSSSLLWAVLAAGIQWWWLGAKTQVFLLPGFLSYLVSQELTRGRATSVLISSGSHLKKRGAAYETGDLCSMFWSPLTNKCVWINTVAFISSKKNTSLCLSSMSQRILIHLDTAPFLLKDTAMQIYSSVFHLFSWSFLIEVKGTLVEVLLWPRESSSFSTSLVFIYFLHVFERRMALFFLSLLKDEDKRKSD